MRKGPRDTLDNMASQPRSRGKHTQRQTPGQVQGAGGYPTGLGNK